MKAKMNLMPFIQKAAKGAAKKIEAKEEKKEKSGKGKKSNKMC
jgi:hypothetical protein